MALKKLEGGYDQSTSAFAKLLASENIQVSYQGGIKTAYFDTKSRVLTLPILKSGVSENVKDMLLGHEVGHALFTPRDDSQYKQYGEQFFSEYLNPLEDLRVEKMIKRKYPGLRRQFSAAYQEMWEKDAFGVRQHLQQTGKNINQLSILDKLHINGKVGPLTGIEFLSDDEKAFQSRVESAETFEDILNVALALYQHEQQKEPPQSQSGDGESDGQQEENQDQQQNGGQGQSGQGNGQGQQGQSGDGDQQGQDGQQGQDESGDGQQGQGQSGQQQGQGQQGQGQSGQQQGQGQQGQGQSGQQQGQGQGDGGQDKQDQGQSGQGQGDGDEQGQPDSSEGSSSSEGGSHRRDVGPQNSQNYSTSSLTNAIDNLVDKHASKVTSCFLPEYDNIFNGRLVVPAKDILKELNAYYRRSNAKNPSDDAYMKFKSDSRQIVNLMVKEFDLKKRADEYRRTSTARTGTLDMNRLHKHKVSDDVFRRVTNVRDGKSHGFVVLLDWSGSMSNQILKTTEQLLVMTQFFKRANVPFDVYLFTDNYRTGSTLKPKSRKIASPSQTMANVYLDDQFCLLNVLSSSLGVRDLDAASKNLYRIAHCIGTHNRQNCPSGYSLGGTPLNESIVALEQIVKKFQKDTGVQVMNTIIMTDGDGGGVYNDGGYGSNGSAILMEGNKNLGKLGTISLLKALKIRTKSNIIGVYLADSYSDARYAPSGSARQKWSEDLRKNDFAVSIVDGYDEHYTMVSSHVGQLDLQLQGCKTDKHVASAFSDAMKERKKSRMMAERFIGRIVDSSEERASK